MSNLESTASVILSPDQSEVLLIKRRDVPVWVLPGGGVEVGESPEAAAIRECLEETGLQVGIERKICCYTPINRLARRTHLYLCKPLKGTLQTGEETREIRYFPLNHLPTPLIPPPFKEWICDALHLEGPPANKLLDKLSYSLLAKTLLAHPLLTLRFLLARLGIPLNSKSF